MDNFRLQATAFGPLIPGIDGDDLRLRRRGQQPLLDDLQGFFEHGRGVARDHRVHDVRGGMAPIGVGRSARAVVPIDHGIRKIRNGIIRPGARPERQIFLAAPNVIGHRESAVVQGAVMHPSVTGQAVEREVAAKLGPAGRRFAAGQIRFAPDDRIDMQPGETGGADLGPKLIERGAGVFNRTKAVEELAHFVDGEIRFAVHQPVAGVLEVSGDDQVANFVPGRGRDFARIQQLEIVIGGIVALDVIPVMVRPHEGELHAGVVGGVEKTFVQRIVEIRSVIVIIPVEDKGIHAVVGSGGDFLRHDFGLRFVLITPKRRLGLHVSGKTRLGGFDFIPLREAGILVFVPARIRMRAGIIIGGNGDWHGDSAWFVRDGTRFLDRHRHIVERGCGLGGLKLNDNHRAGRNFFCNERLLVSVGEFAARKLIQIAVQNARLQNRLAVENVGDIERQHDIRRFFQRADLLAQPAQTRWIADGRCRAILVVHGIIAARSRPATWQAGIPTIVALGQSGEIAEVAIDDFQTRLHGRGKAEQGGQSGRQQNWHMAPHTVHSLPDCCTVSTMAKIFSSGVPAWTL